MTRSIATSFVGVKNYKGLNDEVANFSERKVKITMKDKTNPVFA